MNSKIKEQIHSLLALEEVTMTGTVKLCPKEYGRFDSLSSFSDKLSRESHRYVEGIPLADALGYDLVRQKRRDP